MDKKFSALKFLEQTFMIYGITTGLLNVFCIMFGKSAYGYSTIFSLENKGVSIATSFQFLLAVFIIMVIRMLFMTDILIKKMPLYARIIAMFASVFSVMITFILIFDWFPANMPIAWIMFIICFVLSCVVSTVISVLAEKQENRRLEEALKRYKEEQ